ncbi:MAG: DUF4277 domain-containing protein [Okeania sp. SIO1H6]|nr:DUF4277 domain-containing protein [Okeania sp. SIO1H6]
MRASIEAMFRDYKSGGYNLEGSKTNIDGIIVKSIILNALGLVSRPLYLFTQFFTEKLLYHRIFVQE